MVSLFEVGRGWEKKGRIWLYLVLGCHFHILTQFIFCFAAGYLLIYLIIYLHVCLPHKPDSIRHVFTYISIYISCFGFFSDEWHIDLIISLKLVQTEMKQSNKYCSEKWYDYKTNKQTKTKKPPFKNVVCALV